MDRRSFLAASGSTVLAGCSAAVPPDGGATKSPNAPPRWVPEVPLDGWTMRRGDRRRTGRAPNADLSLSETPQVRWETAVDEHDMGDIVATEYGVVTGTGEDTSTVVFRRNPTKNHRVTAGGHRRSEPAVRDGVLYYGGGSVTAVDVVSDRVEWSAEMSPIPGDKAEAPVPVRGTPAVDEDAVYVVGMWTNDAVSLFALDSSNGSLRWSYEIANRHTDINYDPLLTDGSIAVAVPDPGSDTLRIAAVDRAEGSERWRRSLPIPGGYEQVSDESFTPVAAGDRAIFRLKDAIYAADLRTGTVEWEYHSERGRVVSPIAADDERVYAATRPGHVLALDRQTGTLARTTAIEGRCSEPVAVGDEHIVAVSQRENGEAKGIYPPSTVTAIEKSTGETRWTFERDGTARAPVIGDGSVFVGFWTVRNGAWSSITALG